MATIGDLPDLPSLQPALSSPAPEFRNGEQRLAVTEGSGGKGTQLIFVCHRSLPWHGHDADRKDKKKREKKIAPILL